MVMKIDKTISSALVLIGIYFMTACSAGDTPPVTTTTSALNATVVANAGPDQSVFIGTFVTLNGSGSTTTNSNSLSYAWSLKAKPAGSTATLSNTNLVNPTFTADIAGTYEWQLIVSDGQHTSTPDNVTITAAGTNPQPVANAGLNRPVYIGKVATLDGSASSDVNGDALTYRWTITGKPALSTVFLFDATTVMPAFTPDVAGQYVIQLLVNDGTSDSTPANVTITASIEPPPTANAGPDQIVLPNSLVTLNGNLSSDPGGDALSYQWSLSPPLGVTASLTNPNSINPTFTPSVAGAYTAQLIVTDSTGVASVPDTVLIIVGPRAVAGPAQTVSVDSTVQLTGSGSFGASLTYSWAFTAPLVSGSTAVFSPTNTVINPTFIANVAGTYTITLTVTDSVGRSASATTTVTARTGPVANFTFTPTNPVITATVSLTNISTGTSLAYTWSFASRPTGSTAQFSPNTSATNPTFVADRAGNYDVTLTDRDIVTTAPHSVTKRITTNTPPTATITVPSPVNVCSTVTLSGTSSSDSDGTVASYSWTLTRPIGSGSVLDNAASPTPTFKADKQSLYTVSLFVTDNFGLASTTVSSSFTPAPNPTGKGVYDSGLPNMSSCQSCHAAGVYDTTTSFGAPDLSNTIYAVDRIRNQVKNAGHTGGTTTLTELSNPSLTTQITALRQFLDSTISTGCP
jgi:PKD repeat protein